MNLEALAERLETQSLGTRGTSIFIDSMPVGCKVGVLLLDAYAGTPVNHYMPGYYCGGFRIIVRHTDNAAGKTLARAASAALQMNGVQLTGMFVKQTLPVNLPRGYRRSVGGYWEFEVDVDAYFDETP